ncbi:MAG: KEOPS complex subunit Pcc1 [Candidatus Woesearchaeota archaeon]|jgi:tRNA threonylcarbamoyladenosine modification (KEOPS) complex  Pcc1 subunit
MKAEIYVTSKDVHSLKRCFDAEIATMQTLRSTVAIHTTKDTIQFSVTATDATALRATLNSITKLLSVFEKVKNNE